MEKKDMEKFTRINHPNILQNEVVKVDFQLPDSDSWLNIIIHSMQQDYNPLLWINPQILQTLLLY